MSKNDCVSDMVTLSSNQWLKSGRNRSTVLVWAEIPVFALRHSCMIYKLRADSYLSSSVFAHVYNWLTFRNDDYKQESHQN